MDIILKTGKEAPGRELDSRIREKQTQTEIGSLKSWAEVSRIKKEGEDTTKYLF